MLIRAALFLAVKDVVEGAGASSVVSEADAALSAVLVGALVRVATGRVTGGAAAAAAAARGGGGGGAPGVDAEALDVELGVLALARRLVWRNALGPVVFLTPELGKWSTVGGLGVMVDELSVGLAELGAEVIVISPYYNVNRKGAAGYLAADGVRYSGRNVAATVGGERVEMGVHEGVVSGVRVFFLHNAVVFPRPYPPHDAASQIRVMCAFARGALELLCQWRLIPSLVVTNDWFTGLAPAFARNPRFFGAVFNRTDFMHICHNLDADYEGRMWPSKAQGTLDALHELDTHLLVDPFWADVVLNPTRAALLCSDTWATVSRSYRADLLAGSPLKSLLRLSPHPFAHPNGIPVDARAARLAKLATPSHAAAKAALQEKYFGLGAPDAHTPLFAFVGRITAQKGVHLILNSVERILHEYDFGVHILVGGMAGEADAYGRYCAGLIADLRARFSRNFWADPALFFTDGDLVNLGADFCLMPSAFEPGGIVQQEFFVAGTPVIAFKTGGLKDTVADWDAATRRGTGFTFSTHSTGDLQAAMRLAVGVFREPAAYAALRANARAAVMDLAVVSAAWFREFHRLRRCLPPARRRAAPRVPVRFALRVGEVPAAQPGAAVRVAGTFNAWAPAALPLAFSARDGEFEATVELPPGQYLYKFVIDGKWVATPNAPTTADDGAGIVNNVLFVPAPAPELDDGDE